MDHNPLIERATAFMTAIASHAPWAEIEAFYAPDIVQEEFPNLLLPKGATPNLGELRGSQRSRAPSDLNPDH